LGIGAAGSDGGGEGGKCGVKIVVDPLSESGVVCFIDGKVPFAKVSGSVTAINVNDAWEDVEMLPESAGAVLLISVDMLHSYRAESDEQDILMIFKEQILKAEVLSK
jgi:hypothetical protein